MEIKLPKLSGELVDCKNAIQTFLSLCNEVVNSHKTKSNTTKEERIKFLKENTTLSLTTETKLHPIHFLLFLKGPWGIEFNDEWSKIDSKHAQELQKIMSNNGLEWVNIDSVYPNYENEGYISMHRFLVSAEEEIKKHVFGLLDAFFGFQEQNTQEITRDELEIIKWAFLEIITNAYIHGFDNKNNDVLLSLFIEKKTHKIYFSIIDNGVGIPKSVLKHKKLKNNKQAFEWAMEKFNTTKKNEENGGKGLFDVKNIIKKSKGEMLIWSNDIIWMYSSNNENIQRNFYSFSGTAFYGIVSIEEVIRDFSELISDEVEKETEVFFNGD